MMTIYIIILKIKREIKISYKLYEYHIFGYKPYLY